MRVRRSWIVVGAAAVLLLMAGAGGPIKPPPPQPGDPGGGGGSGYAGDQNGPLGHCPVFPPTAQPGYLGWNDDVSQMPLSPNSANYIANIDANGGNHYLHADFG